MYVARLCTRWTLFASHFVGLIDIAGRCARGIGCYVASGYRKSLMRIGTEDRGPFCAPLNANAPRSALWS
jgi:hypothetical protein